CGVAFFALCFPIAVLHRLGPDRFDFLALIGGEIQRREKSVLRRCRLFRLAPEQADGHARSEGAEKCSQKNQAPLRPGCSRIRTWTIGSSISFAGADSTCCETAMRSQL